MFTTIKPLTQLFLSCFVFMAGSGLVNLLIPLRLSGESIGTDKIGMVIAIYSVGYLLGASYSKKILSRVGHIRTFSLCGSLMSFAILICAINMDLWVWALMRLMMGFAVAIVIATFDGWLSQVATQENRGRLLAFNQIIVFGAICISQFFIVFAPPSAPTLFILSGILFSISIVPLVVSRIHSPVVKDFESLPLRQTFSISPLGAVSCLFCGLLNASLMNLLPLYAGAYGVADMELSILMASAVAGIIMMQLPVGYLSDRFDRRRLIFAIVLLLIVLSVAFPLAFQNGLHLVAYLLISMMSGLILCLYPLSISETFDKVQQSQMLAAMSSLLSFYALGSIVGPYVASLMMQHMGPQGLFVNLGVLELLLFVFVVYRTQARASLPLEQQEAFVMNTPSSESPHLDPRTIYQEPEVEVSPGAEAVAQLATENPSAAIALAQVLVKDDESQAKELAAALSDDGHIEITQVYESIVKETPQQDAELASKLIAEHPEQMEPLVEYIMQDNPENRNSILLSIADGLPNFGSAAIQTAVDNIGEEQTDELVELTEEYFSQVSEQVTQMRPADLDAENPEQAIAEVFQHVVDSDSQQVKDIAHSASEAMPDASSMVTEAYVQSLVHQEDETSARQDEVNAELTDYLEHVIQNQPELATEVAATIVDNAPEHAEDIEEVLQASKVE
ncbi:MFS transporter [Shewanella gelidii]|uniref:Major facilitator superfamily (MFS) profile domain-containing protein n=1 Tax=Shewanella gelidii TaxID=1642821 RepID=A0A917JLX2_9GAMM|nr:MFS transporter [Shewanella gelidii]MCL1096997.1 MFS transporter [Shewanella gelidii]GGI71813.1 hypothetical protein GCM10009332_06450 [Shewanella gelidii]